jgi:hypothetical protein
MTGCLRVSHEPESILHPQVHIEHGDQSADVDEDIAEFILATWRLGLWTLMSCQDNEGAEGEGGPRRVWVQLPALDAEQFLSIVAGVCPDEVDQLDPDCLYNRVIPEVEPEDWETFRRGRMWHYAALPEDMRGVPGESAQVDLAVSVRFPFTDLPEVLARLRAAERHP